MLPSIIVGVSLGLIVASLLFIKTNAAVVFFGLCAGYVLSQQASGTATEVSNSFTKGGFATSTTVQIVLIVLPAILSALFLRKTMDKSKAIVNILPALCVAALAAILIVPLLGGSVQATFEQTTIWQNLSRDSDLVVIAGVLASILALYVSAHSGGRHRKHHKK